MTITEQYAALIEEMSNLNEAIAKMEAARLSMIESMLKSPVRDPHMINEGVLTLNKTSGLDGLIEKRAALAKKFASVE